MRGGWPDRPFVLERQTLSRERDRPVLRARVQHHHPGAQLNQF
jgi:hypothetical protein